MWPDLFRSFFQPLLYADFQFPSCIMLLNRLPSTQRPFSCANSSMTENLATMGQARFKSEIDTKKRQKTFSPQLIIKFNTPIFVCILSCYLLKKHNLMKIYFVTKRNVLIGCSAKIIPRSHRMLYISNPLQQQQIKNSIMNVESQ